MLNKTELVTKANRTFAKVGFQLKKHSPTILVAAGTVGVVASAVMACKATTKLNDILDDSKAQLDNIHAVMKDEEFKKENNYTDQDGKKDLTIVYTQTGVKLAKLYGPAIAVGTLSLASILYSHNILTKRNVALAAAYTAVDQGFKEYRGRVVERFGEMVDRELRYNIKAKEIEVIETNEKGEEVTVKKEIQVADVNPNEYSVYARFFDESSRYWEKNPELNLMFLKTEERWANDKLRARGFLFLNEVYERLGIPVTQAGQVVGWIYDPDCPNGDNYIDFGIHDINKASHRDFVNGYERSICLDFNVDGNIWELMPTRQGVFGF